VNLNYGKSVALKQFDIYIQKQQSIKDH